MTSRYDYHFEEESEGLFKVVIEATFENGYDEDFFKRITSGGKESPLSKYLFEKEKLRFIEREDIYRDKFRSIELEVAPKIIGSGIEVRIKTYKKAEESIDQIIDLNSLYNFIKEQD